MPGQPSALRRELALYLSAQQFLTRLPSPAWIGWEDDRLARAAKHFPTVGLCLGLWASIIWLLATWCLPPLVAAALTVLSLMLLTGMLHEDGLADCADGFGGGATRERALDIMRDSRIGAYGAGAIGMALLVRVAALSELSPATGVAALFIALVAGRAGMTLTLTIGDYARTEGAAREAGGVRYNEMLFAILFAFLTGSIAGGVWGLIAVLAVFALAWLWLSYATRRIGGYTGDTLGAVEMMGQTLVLVVLAGAWA